jgi:hypothetical protein
MFQSEISGMASWCSAGCRDISRSIPARDFRILARPKPSHHEGEHQRSVLWYGPDFLSNAGLQDGFDKVNYVNNLHLMMNVDPRVVNGVVRELRDLVQWERAGWMMTMRVLVAARPDWSVAT